MLRSHAYSFMNIYAYSCLELLSNRPEAALKQQNPCSNHEIHVAFEHGFYLNIHIACRILLTDVTVNVAAPGQLFIKHSFNVNVTIKFAE